MGAEAVTQAMSTRLLFVTLLAVGATISSAHNSSAASSTVYIIRHGEKTWGGGCLNIEGQERANNLPNVFNGKASSSHQTFETPTALFANNYDAQPECERCWLTVSSISRALRIPIDFDHGYPSLSVEIQGLQTQSAMRQRLIEPYWSRGNTSTFNT